MFPTPVGFILNSSEYAKGSNGGSPTAFAVKNGSFLFSANLEIYVSPPNMILQSESSSKFPQNPVYIHSTDVISPYCAGRYCFKET